MDVNDIFKKLTTNLSFGQNLGLNLKKRKSDKADGENGGQEVEENEHEVMKRPKLDEENEPSQKSASKSSKAKKNKPKKKKNLIQINQEKVNHIRNMMHINVNGDDIPDPIENLSQLYADCENDDEFHKLYQMRRCPKQLLENFKGYKFKELTPVQMQVLPIMLNNREVMACAPTGSGKTLAFLFPTICHLSNLKEAEKQGIKALILAPTRELVQQIYLESCRLANKLDIYVHLISNTNNEVKKLKEIESKRTVILITTPNRLIHLLGTEGFDDSLKKVEFLIVDEADKLFEEGQQSFRDQLGVIYKTCDNTRIKHAFFSATFTNEVEQWCKLNLNNVIQVSIGRKNNASYSIEQELMYVGNEEGKIIALRNQFKKGFEPPILIFVETKEKAEYLFKELIYDNINVDLISADRTQTQRDNTMRSFRQGKIWVLICTELLGRGIDFKGVNLVINYDFPLSGISYVHRIGRSGRAGRLGNAVTFFTDDDLPYLKRIVNIMREAGCRVPDYMLELKSNKNKIDDFSKKAKKAKRFKSRNKNTKKSPNKAVKAVKNNKNKKPIKNNK